MIHSQDFNQMPFFPVRSFVWVKENSSLTWSATPHWLTREKVRGHKTAHPPMSWPSTICGSGDELWYKQTGWPRRKWTQMCEWNEHSIYRWAVSWGGWVPGQLSAGLLFYPNWPAMIFIKKILVLGLSWTIRRAWAEWEEINRVVDADREASARLNNELNTDKSDHNQILKSGVRRGVNNAGWRVPFSL